MTQSGRAVFLSYASQDAPAAERLCETLRNAGVEVWFDQRELRGGDAWDALIRRQIKGCYLFVPLISANTQAREEGYFRLEWKLAVNRTNTMAEDRTFLLPVVIDGTADAQARVPEKFRDVQWTRLPGGASTQAFVAHVSQLLLLDAATSSRTSTSASVPRAAPSVGTPARLASPAFRFFPWTVIALLILTLGYLGAHRFLAHQQSVPAAVPAVGNATNMVSDKSVAVLPFADMSEKKDQEYFSDGLAEELIEQLGRTSGLKVIARTSSFSFKGKSDDITTIAAKLKAANILEGSVRRAGNHLRVSAHLIRAESGEPLWSQTFDRQFKDVFSIQDEIATAVVSALKVRLTGSEVPNHGHGTTNAEAYNAFLLGRQFFNQRTEAGYRQAIETYQKAVGLDPLYAEAYAELSSSEFWLSDLLNNAALAKSAEQTVQRALELNPRLAVGYSTRADLRMWMHFDWAGALADHQHALTLEPLNSRVLKLYADYLLFVGSLDKAVATYRIGIDDDPLADAMWSNLGKALTAQGHYAAAYEAFRQAVAIRNEPLGSFGLATLQLLDGKPRAALDTARTVGIGAFRVTGIAIAEHMLGDEKASQQAIETLIATYAGTAPYNIAQVYASRGEKDTAFIWLERAFHQHDVGLVLFKIDPLMASLRSDPRFGTFLHKMNFPP